MSTSIALTTTSPEDTRAAAAAMAGVLRAGDVVALNGGLGAGKTCFVQGAAARLEVALPVTSPTFVLVKLLPAPVPVVHVDVYRLERLRHLDDLGEEVFAPDVVTFVEWADRIGSFLPPDRLEVGFTVAGEPNDPRDPADGRDQGDEPARRLTLHAYGPAWAPRLEALGRACEPWA